jgi:hypothetical protein
MIESLVGHFNQALRKNIGSGNHRRVSQADRHYISRRRKVMWNGQVSKGDLIIDKVLGRVIFIIVEQGRE